MDSDNNMPKQAALPARRRKRGPLFRSEEGSAILELAFTVPLLILLFAGISIAGLDMCQYNGLTDAVGVGARAISMTRGQTSPPLAASDPCAYAVSLANADATTLILSKITYTITYTPVAGTTPTVYTVPYTAGSGSGCPGLTQNTGDQVTMTATYPAISVTSKGNNWLQMTSLGTLNLSAHSSQQVQ